MLRCVATFLLLHGAWHDARCWAPLARELEERGHAALAPDLPGEDHDATWDDYVGAALAVVGPDEPAPVVVGHSLCGRWLDLVAARRPVACLVYLCARLPDVDGQPSPYRPALDHVGRDGEGRSTWTPDTALWAMYGRLPGDTAEELAQRLRPQSFRFLDFPRPPFSLGSTPAVAIACEDDEFFALEWERFAARALLGHDVIELPGGHYPMAEQPAELATLLDALAAQAQAVGTPEA